jgi:transglutaminase-like putative cysteine protease
VYEQAKALAEGVSNKTDLAERCFTFVRDAIDHSFDIEAEPVTCHASEVLTSGHGICYAKSHLLAALLRANNIPAGIGYQRLADETLGYALHAYNTVLLPRHGWYRIDARGNTGSVDARFSPPEQRLAFPTEARGEVDYHLNLARPLPEVVQALRRAETLEQLRQSLPSSIRMG